MTAAILLAKLGLSVVILEQQETPSSAPKAISLDDESLRTYQAAGVVDRVLSIIVPGTGTMYYGVDGEVLFHARGPVPYRLGHPFKNPFAQPDLERVLRDVILEQPGIDLRYGSTVFELDQDIAGVSIEVETSGGVRSLRSRYLIGADGGRSTIRESLGITMTGKSHPETWLVIDTLEDEHQERYGMHHGEPARPHVIVPGLDGRCRYEFLLFDGEGTAGQDPGFELMRTLLAPYRDLRPEQIERAVNYRFNALNADSWKSGRAFLAGDAAHMMPPFAGQGLNSGIRDVTNLCWKLAAAVKGRLSEIALDSYQDERKPHAQATIRLSERLGRVVMTTSPRLAGWRDSTIRTALATPAGRTYLEEMRYRPTIRFEKGLIVHSNSQPRIGKGISQPRVFDAESHRPRMFDEVVAGGWSIVGVDVDPEDWVLVAQLRDRAHARAIHIPTSDSFPRLTGRARVLVDLDGSLNREFESFVGHFVLIRPDHIIAAVWRPTETERILRQTREWFPHSAVAARLVEPESTVTTRAGVER
ncbi:monooxygenase [Lacisediminihabitans profunda]|uniref:Monooxygenase n=2 Tax=Lacisediminihabitans profunda TaxID=2594790 RepID=A0A5C8UQ82_9MICO|nr:monooxygenase [Lacisediminihabitans profunda]